MNDIWLTADTHFGHRNIIRHCSRPFSSTEEMDATIINNWNALIAPNHIVWHLGDVCFRGQHPRHYLKRLNGKIHVCVGNHDKLSELLECAAEGIIEDVVVAKRIKWNKQKFWLSHYAHVVWDGSHKGVPHFFGHSHGALKANMPNSLDVGVDVHGFYPIRIQTAIKLLE